MKVYYPKSVIPDPEAELYDAEQIRGIFVSYYPQSALHEADVTDVADLIVLDVPDVRLMHIQHLSEDRYEEMEPIMRKRAVRSYFAQLTDSEIYEAMDATGIEYQADQEMRF